MNSLPQHMDSYFHVDVLAMLLQLKQCPPNDRPCTAGCMQDDDWGYSRFPFIPGHEVSLAPTAPDWQHLFGSHLVVYLFPAWGLYSQCMNILQMWQSGRSQEPLAPVATLFFVLLFRTAATTLLPVP
jgi:hypothetical protein